VKYAYAASLIGHIYNNHYYTVSLDTINIKTTIIITTGSPIISSYGLVVGQLYNATMSVSNVVLAGSFSIDNNSGFIAAISNNSNVTVYNLKVQNQVLLVSNYFSLVIPQVVNTSSVTLISSIFQNLSVSYKKGNWSGLVFAFVNASTATL
jgi:hypothetical protein